MDRRNNIEAVACVRKYFVAASVDRGFLKFVISGMMARRFISRPIHIRNMLVLNIVIMGPEKIVR